MSDPLSIAGSVAGLIALAGSTSKIFYQFSRSIHDAPSSARELASGLFSLNIALGQVQEVLLNPDFVEQSEDRDSEALEHCLSRCVVILTDVEKRITKSGLIPDGVRAKGAWQSVKWSFNEDDMVECRRLADEEKSNLTVILNAYNARMISSLIGEMRRLQVIASQQGEALDKQHRMLQDIYVVCQWAAGTSHQERGRVNSQHKSEYSGFTASEAFGGNLAHLLGSSDSMLALRIGDIREDTISAVWSSDNSSGTPIRRSRSIFSPHEPSLKDLNSPKKLFSTTDHIISPSLTAQRMESLSKLQSFAADSQKQGFDSRNRTTLKPLLRLQPFIEAMTNPSPEYISLVWGVFRSILEVPSNLGGEIRGITEDLQDFPEYISTVNTAMEEIEASESLLPLAKEVHFAIHDFCVFASRLFKKHLSSLVLGKSVNVNQRQELRSKVNKSYAVFMRRYEILSKSQLLRLQKQAAKQQQESLYLYEKQLAMQERILSKLSLVEAPINLENDLDE